MKSNSIKFKIFLFYIIFSFIVLFIGGQNSNHAQDSKIPISNGEISITTVATYTPPQIIGIVLNSADEVGDDQQSGELTETDMIREEDRDEDDEDHAQYYKVVKVVDGDTIDVKINSQVQRVRLIGINTPEVVDPRKPVECFGQEASAKAHQWLDNQEVTLESDSSQDDKDKYNRLLRYITTREGLFYNLEIIKAGYAYEYTYNLPYKYQNEFKAAQTVAQTAKLGLWADEACGLKNVSGLVVAGSATGSSSECKIKGNINAKKEKIYHLENCPYYKNTIIDLSAGEKWFCSEAGAVAAGWRKAKNCP